MDSESISQLAARVNRELLTLDEIEFLTSEQCQRVDELLTIRDSLTVVIGFLNREYSAFCKARR